MLDGFAEVKPPRGGRGGGGAGGGGGGGAAAGWGRPWGTWTPECGPFNWGTHIVPNNLRGP